MPKSRDWMHMDVKSSPTIHAGFDISQRVCLMTGGTSGIGQMAILVALATIAGVAVGAGLVALMSSGDAPVELDVTAVLTVFISLVVAGVLGSLVAFRRVTQVEPAIALGVEP